MSKGLIIDVTGINELNDIAMIYTLPPLPYATDALEPKMSQETIEYHYGKHAQAYVDKLNTLTAGTSGETMSLEEHIMSSNGPVFNNAAQVWNHIFFFNTLVPVPVEIPAGLKVSIENDFGSVDEFRKKFEEAAMGLFGSGWVWLAQDRNGSLHIIQESNAGNPMRSGYKPLMTIDIWEHAYYIDCRNRRAEYVKRIWELTDWNIVAGRLEDDTVTVTGLAGSEIVKETMAEIIEEDEGTEEAEDSARYVCIVCGWVYDPDEGDPDSGIAPGTPFKDIPDDWTCPACGVGKEHFEPER